MGLKICKDRDPNEVRSTNSLTSQKVEAEAYWERQWLIHPQTFNPNLTAEGRIRIHRTWKLIYEHFSRAHLKCVDLGSGYGILSRKCAEAGGEVTAVDIAERALHHLKQEKAIHCEKQWMPYTTLPDMYYDLVISTDLIAWLPEHEYRLFFSELTRLATKNGKIIVSTPLDIDSENALERFLALAETELQIESIQKSFHAIKIRLLRTLKRWKWGRTLFKPLIRLLETNDWLLKKLENLTQFLYPVSGISHVVVVGLRRPLFTHREDNTPIERKTKKMVWE